MVCQTRDFSATPSTRYSEDEGQTSLKLHPFAPPFCGHLSSQKVKMEGLSLDPKQGADLARLLQQIPLEQQLRGQFLPRDGPKFDMGKRIVTDKGQPPEPQPQPAPAIFVPVSTPKPEPPKPAPEPAPAPANQNLDAWLNGLLS